MATIIDYVDWRGDLSFEASPFNDVDNLILSQLVYIDFDDVIPSGDSSTVSLADAQERLAELYPDGVECHGLQQKKLLNELFDKAAHSQRFGGIQLFLPHSRLDVENQEQFYAITFILGDGNMYVAFRGTDQTLVGWKEDFNMGFTCPVPSQLEAVSYLENVAFLRSENIFTGGHSKGGNLAMYSAAFSQGLSDRVVRIYSDDGPGFPAGVVDSEEFSRILGKIIAIVPEGSVVGMLLEHRAAYSVVKSTQRGISQHDGFSWEVLGGHFIELRARSTDSIIIDKTLSQWIALMSENERKTFVSTLYDVITSSGAQTISELSAEAFKTVKSLKTIDPKTKEIISLAIKELKEQAMKITKEVVQEKILQKNAARITTTKKKL